MAETEPGAAAAALLEPKDTLRGRPDAVTEAGCDADGVVNAEAGPAAAAVGGTDEEDDDSPLPSLTRLADSSVPSSSKTPSFPAAVVVVATVIAAACSSGRCVGSAAASADAPAEGISPADLHARIPGPED